MEAFKKFTAKNYAEQGKAFLNAYWNEHQKDAESIWTWALKFAELDLDRKADGNDLDEFNAHRFLEGLQETKTVRQMRTEIKDMDIDFNKRLALLEYCLWKFKHSVTDFVKRPQGDNQEELKKAQKLLDEVLAAFREVEKSANIAKAREKEAQDREREAIEAEKPFKIAQEELNAALAELAAQEKAYKDKTADLTQKSESGGAVQKNKAKAELEIHLREDPLPLRKAKISTEAAERKAEKVRAPFKEAREKAEEARRIAAAARAKADADLEEAGKRLQAAEDYLNEVRKQPGQPYGALWWIDRELEEKRRFLPQSKRK